MKIYISGKITGLPQEKAMESFNNAESFLLDCGFDVFNPMKNELPFDASWEDHMAADIRALLDCDAIYMMDGWLDSKGATIEYDIAMRMEMHVLFETIMKNENRKIQRIKNAIHQVTGLRYSEYAVKQRSVKLTYARLLFANQCRKCHMTLLSIGMLLHRDHTAIIYLLRKYEQYKGFDPSFAPLAHKCEELLKDLNEKFVPGDETLKKRRKRKSKSKRNNL